MDDFSGLLGELLKNPAVANLLGQLGSTEETEGEAAAPPQEGPPPTQNPGAGMPPLGGLGLDPELLQTIMKLMPLLSNLREEDENTRLLNALRPMLKPERQKKLDEASKLMRLMKMLPLLKNQGIF